MSCNYQQNVLADIQAKHILYNYIIPVTNILVLYALFHFHLQCTLSISAIGKDNSIHMFHSNLQKTLVDSSTILDICQHWKIIHLMGGYSHSVVWNLWAKSAKAFTYSKNRWLSKFCTGFCKVAKVLEVYNYQKHLYSPRCNENSHVNQSTEASSCI